MSTRIGMRFASAFRGGSPTTPSFACARPNGVRAHRRGGRHCLRRAPAAARSHRGATCPTRSATSTRSPGSRAPLPRPPCSPGAAAPQRRVERVLRQGPLARADAGKDVASAPRNRTKLFQDRDRLRCERHGVRPAHLRPCGRDGPDARLKGRIPATRRAAARRGAGTAAASAAAPRASPAVPRTHRSPAAVRRMPLVRRWPRVASRPGGSTCL